MDLCGAISRMANATRPDRPESNLILVEQIIRSEYFIPVYDHFYLPLSIYLFSIWLKTINDNDFSIRNEYDKI